MFPMMSRSCGNSSIEHDSDVVHDGVLGGVDGVLGGVPSSKPHEAKEEARDSNRFTEYSESLRLLCKSGLSVFLSQNSKGDKSVCSFPSVPSAIFTAGAGPGPTATARKSDLSRTYHSIIPTGDFFKLNITCMQCMHDCSGLAVSWLAKAAGPGPAPRPLRSAESLPDRGRAGNWKGHLRD